MDPVLGVLGLVVLWAWLNRDDGSTYDGGEVEAFLMVGPSWWRSGTADRLGLDNTPDAQAMTNLARLAAACDEVFGVNGYDVTSGFRSPAVNLALSASGNDAVSLTSLHLSGRGADIYVHGLDVESAADLARASGRFTEIITYADGHLHVGIGRG